MQQFSSEEISKKRVSFRAEIRRAAIQKQMREARYSLTQSQQQLYETESSSQPNRNILEQEYSSQVDPVCLKLEEYRVSDEDQLWDQSIIDFIDKLLDQELTPDLLIKIEVLMLKMTTYQHGNRLTNCLQRFFTMLQKGLNRHLQIIKILLNISEWIFHSSKSFAYQLFIQSKLTHEILQRSSKSTLFDLIEVYSNFISRSPIISYRQYPNLTDTFTRQVCQIGTEICRIDLSAPLIHQYVQLLLNIVKTRQKQDKQSFLSSLLMRRDNIPAMFAFLSHYSEIWGSGMRAKVLKLLSQLYKDDKQLGTQLFYVLSWKTGEVILKQLSYMERQGDFSDLSKRYLISLFLNTIMLEGQKCSAIIFLHSKMGSPAFNKVFLMLLQDSQVYLNSRDLRIRLCTIIFLIFKGSINGILIESLARHFFREMVKNMSISFQNDLKLASLKVINLMIREPIFSPKLKEFFRHEFKRVQHFLMQQPLKDEKTMEVLERIEEYLVEEETEKE